MLSSKLHQRMIMYSEGRISLSELESWIAPRLRLFFDEADSVEGDIVATIESLIIEYRDGLITESELRAEVTDLLDQQQTVMLSIEPPGTSFSTISSSSTSIFRQSFHSSSRESLPGGNTIILDVER